MRVSSNQNQFIMAFSKRYLIVVVIVLGAWSQDFAKCTSTTIPGYLPRYFLHVNEANRLSAVYPTVRGRKHHIWYIPIVP